jgi:hypothetical protein
MAYRRSALQHRPDVLGIKEVCQLPNGDGGAPLSFFCRGVAAKSDGGEHVGGGLTRLFGRQLSDLAKRDSLLCDTASAAVRPILTDP